MAYNPVEMKGDFSLHEVCLGLHISREILLNYEKLGLIRPTEVKDSGYRYYSPEAVARLLYIERLKKSGLPLKEIRLFLEGNLGAEKKIEELENKARTIQGLIDNLKIDLEPQGIFTIEPPRRILCSVLDCPYSTNLKDNYLNARRNIARNVKAASSFDAETAYFAYFPAFFENGKIANSTPAAYQQCIPLLSKEKAPDARMVSLRSTLRYRCSVSLSFDRNVAIADLLKKAKELGLTLDGGFIFVSDTAAVAREGKPRPYIVSYIAEFKASPTLWNFSDKN
jgi:DNA-binding transcriptional MerR regulator